MNGGRTFLVAAVEPSADAIGADLIAELRKLHPSARFIGCGGPEMAKAGLASAFEIERLSVIGAITALMAAPEAFKRADELAALAAAESADAAILIDAWGFSKLAAQKMRRRSPTTQIYKMVAPQVWASRPKRAATLSALFDGVLCLFPFEPVLFTSAGARAAFVGNPNFQAAWRAQGDGAAFRNAHQIGPAPLLALAPGSRRAEIDRLMKPFEATVQLLIARAPDLRLVLAAAPAVARWLDARLRSWPVTPLIVSGEARFAAFAAADAAIAKSGTVTTELAICRTPMVVAYRVDPFTALWIRAIATTPFVSILNIAAGRYVVPELLQERCTPENLAGAVLPLLLGGESRAEQLQAFPPLLASLGVDGPPAAQRSAEQIMAWMEASPVRRLSSVPAS